MAQFLVPNAIADIVKEPSNDEVRRGTKLSLAIQPGYEAIYYEIIVVLEVTLLMRGISVVLGLPMNSQSSTFDVYHAIPLHQLNGGQQNCVVVPASVACLSSVNRKLPFRRAR